MGNSASTESVNWSNFGGENSAAARIQVEMQKAAAQAAAKAAAEQQAAQAAAQAAAEAQAQRVRQQQEAQRVQQQQQQAAAAAAAAAQAAALESAKAQQAAAAKAAAEAAEKQRLAQEQIRLAAQADELAKLRAQYQSQAALLATTQAREQQQAAQLTTVRAEAADTSQTVTSHDFTDLGCWNDAPDRAISGGFTGTPGTDAYNSSRCYDLAVSRGHNIFAVQAGFACFTGLEMRDNYKKYGAAQGYCGVGGGSWVNHVYKINSPSVVIPHDVGAYSDWSAVPSLFSDFQKQSSSLLKSLSTPDTSNPAPYMTALDTNVNAIRDAATIQQLNVRNSRNITDATQIFHDATNMDGPLKDSRDEAENLRRQITLSTSQSSGYEQNILPLKILAATLACVLVLHFVLGIFVSSSVSSFVVLAALAVGFGVALYVAIRIRNNTKQTSLA